MNLRVRASIRGMEQPTDWSAAVAAQQGLHPRVIVLAVLALAVGLLCLMQRRGKYDLDKMPGPWRHEAWPVVGNVVALFRPDFHRVMLRYTDQYGGIFRLKFLWRDAVFVSDPAALASIMSRGDGACDKASQFYFPINQMCDPHGSYNILTAPSNDMWRAVRKAVAVSFSASNVRKKFSLIRERCLALCERLGRNGPGAVVDVDQAALKVTLDVIGLAGFGHKYHAVEQETITANPTDLMCVLPRCFSEVLKRIANPLRAPLSFASRESKEGAVAFKAFQAEMCTLLSEMQQRGAPADDDQSIAAQLFRVMKDTPGITEARLLSEIAVLFVGGFETTAHTISWTLFNIATIPGVQQRVAAELDALGLLAKPQSAKPRPLELDDLKGLKYLTAVNKESMRMYPAVPLIGRMTPKQPTKIGPYTVPPNTPIAVSLFAVHNTKHNWEQPGTFRPERWLDVPLESYVADGNSSSSSTAAQNGLVAGGDSTNSSGAAQNGHVEEGNSTNSSSAAGQNGTLHLAPTNGSSSSSSSSSSKDTYCNGYRPAYSSSSEQKASSGATTSTTHMTQANGAHTPNGTHMANDARMANGEHSSGGHKALGGDGGGHSKAAAAPNFMPFAEGQRNCVGQNLAKLEVLVLLATLLGHFRLELAPEMGGRKGVHKRQSACFTLHVDDDQGIRCRLYPRCNEAPRTQLMKLAPAAPAAAAAAAAAEPAGEV